MAQIFATGFFLRGLLYEMDVEKVAILHPSMDISKTVEV